MSEQKEVSVKNCCGKKNGIGFEQPLFSPSINKCFTKCTFRPIAVRQTRGKHAKYGRFWGPGSVHWTSQFVAAHCYLFVCAIQWFTRSQRCDTADSNRWMPSLIERKVLEHLYLKAFLKLFAYSHVKYAVSGCYELTTPWHTVNWIQATSILAYSYLSAPVCCSAPQVAGRATGSR